MNVHNACSIIRLTRHSLDVFIRHFDAIRHALPTVPPELNQAHYETLACLSHLNHALNALDHLYHAAKLSDPPTSHTAPGRPTTPGLEPSPNPPP